MSRWCDGAFGLLLCSIAEAGPLTLTGWKHVCLRTSLGTRSFFILELCDTSAVCSTSKLEGLEQASKYVEQAEYIYAWWCLIAYIIEEKPSKSTNNVFYNRFRRKPCDCKDHKCKNTSCVKSKKNIESPNQYNWNVTMAYLKVIKLWLLLKCSKIWNLIKM